MCLTTISWFSWCDLMPYQSKTLALRASRGWVISEKNLVIFCSEFNPLKRNLVNSVNLCTLRLLTATNSSHVNKYRQDNLVHPESNATNSSHVTNTDKITLYISNRMLQILVMWTSTDKITLYIPNRMLQILVMWPSTDKITLYIPNRMLQILVMWPIQTR
jgi:hypothetical protein